MTGFFHDKNPPPIFTLLVKHTTRISQMIFGRVEDFSQNDLMSALRGSDRKNQKVIRNNMKS
jgi:hypothetical protein